MVESFFSLVQVKNPFFTSQKIKILRIQTNVYTQETNYNLSAQLRCCLTAVKDYVHSIHVRGWFHSARPGRSRARETARSLQAPKLDLCSSVRFRSPPPARTSAPGHFQTNTSHLTIQRKRGITVANSIPVRPLNRRQWSRSME